MMYIYICICICICIYVCKYTSFFGKDHGDSNLRRLFSQLKVRFKKKKKIQSSWLNVGGNNVRQTAKDPIKGYDPSSICGDVFFQKPDGFGGVFWMKS